MNFKNLTSNQLSLLLHISSETLKFDEDYTFTREQLTKPKPKGPGFLNTTLDSLIKRKLLVAFYEYIYLPQSVNEILLYAALKSIDSCDTIEDYIKDSMKELNYAN